MSLFDQPEFNEALFFPRDDRTSPPPGAIDLEVRAPDATLHVRWHQHARALPTLLLFHGNGEVVADYDELAPRFTEAGVSLAVMDYRGYGLSTGRPTLRTVLADAPRVLHEVHDRVQTPIIVMGRSLGSACAAALYAEPPDYVRGFVIESGFVDLRASIRRRGLQPPNEIAVADRAAFDPVPKLARGSRPLLVLHGANDTMIDPAEAKQAFDAAGTRDKQLVYVPSRGHNDVSFSAVYWDALATFVRRVARADT